MIYRILVEEGRMHMNKFSVLSLASLVIFIVLYYVMMS